jgi:hypothetical protein
MNRDANDFKKKVNYGKKVNKEDNREMNIRDF